MLVAGRGVIVAGFFDTGESRVLPWARRPQAAALVAQLADPDRGWDAIVIGEYERAFYGSQYALMAPLFEHYGVSLWMPEVGGRVDWHADDHEETMLSLGLSSKREIARTWVRVRTPMNDNRIQPGAGARHTPDLPSSVSGHHQAPWDHRSSNSTSIACCESWRRGWPPWHGGRRALRWRYLLKRPKAIAMKRVAIARPGRRRDSG
jgi:hypothetical protein